MRPTTGYLRRKDRQALDCISIPSTLTSIAGTEYPLAVTCPPSLCLLDVQTAGLPVLYCTVHVVVATRLLTRFVL